MSSDIDKYNVDQTQITDEQVARAVRLVASKFADDVEGFKTVISALGLSPQVGRRRVVGSDFDPTGVSLPSRDTPES